MPTFLADILRCRPIDFRRINVSESILGAYEPANPNGTTILYQTGYLTIHSCRNLGGSRYYTLDFPNREIRQSFLHDISHVYAGIGESEADSAQTEAVTALYDHDVYGFVRALKAFFTDIPYDMTDRQNEQMWQTICYVVLRSIGVNVNGEVRTHDARMDMVVDLPGDIYIIEFKLDRPASEAMEQIRGKDYAGKYALATRFLPPIHTVECTR